MSHAVPASGLCALVLLVPAALRSRDPDAGPGVRRIPIVVTGEVRPGAPGGALPLTVTIRNGLDGPIEFHGFGTQATAWNAETVSLVLMDIHRDGKAWELFLKAPEVSPPPRIAGQSRTVIGAGQSLRIETDARKWTLRDGWLPGRYQATVRVRGLRADDYAVVDVRSEPLEFEVP